MKGREDLLFEIIETSEYDLKKEKIGELVRATLPIILLENLISETEIKKLQEYEYSKLFLELNYPVLKKIDPILSVLENRMINEHTRYYAGVYENSGDQYLICSEWYERSLENYIKWLKRKVVK